MQLRELAHTRTGDKGNRSTLTVIAFDPRDFARIQGQLTPERVRAHYHGMVRGEVERFVLPHLGALQFVMHEALAGGVTRSLALDAHGKTLSSHLLDIDIE
ncbi:MAG: hypothetical protein ACKOWC_07950 [Limnohabitans sp.]